MFKGFVLMTEFLLSAEMTVITEIVNVFLTGYGQLN